MNRIYKFSSSILRTQYLKPTTTTLQSQPSIIITSNTLNNKQYATSSNATTENTTTTENNNNNIEQLLKTPIINENFSQESVEKYNTKNNFRISDNSFAVVHLGGKQYKVIKGDVIMTDKLLVEVGEHIVLDKVLLYGTKETTAIGTPLLSNVKVHAFIEEQTKSEHVTIFKHKRRKNFKRTTGFTPLATVVRIGDIIIENN
eukprot:gene2800-3481_t